MTGLKGTEDYVETAAPLELILLKNPKRGVKCPLCNAGFRSVVILEDWQTCMGGMGDIDPNWHNVDARCSLCCHNFHYGYKYSWEHEAYQIYYSVPARDKEQFIVKGIPDKWESNHTFGCEHCESGVAQITHTKLDGVTPAEMSDHIVTHINGTTTVRKRTFKECRYCAHREELLDDN